MAKAHYKLICEYCGADYNDDGLRLECEIDHQPSLLTTEYVSKHFETDTAAEGIYRYKKWLPVRRSLGGGRTVTYKSERLNQVIGLPNLWVAFNGFWPEKQALLETATFKELEAYSVLGRLPSDENSILVVASAGNTSAAFAHVCSTYGIPCLLVIPESGMMRMAFPSILNPCVKIVSISGFADYFEAIKLAESISKLEKFIPEGGVKNVGRRDGLGTTLLAAVEVIGCMPDYYFQAIGSGAGAIAVFRSAKRLAADGKYGYNVPRLMLSQNLPFVPVYLSWKSRQRELITFDADAGKRQIQQIAAQVLSNRHPPYSVRGGLFDVLNSSQGDVFVADNLESLHASRLFEEIERIDIDAASAVALATLIKAAKSGQVEPESVVLLNVTGGGWMRRKQLKQLIQATPNLQIDAKEIFLKDTLEKIRKLFF